MWSNHPGPETNLIMKIKLENQSIIYFSIPDATIGKPTYLFTILGIIYIIFCQQFMGSKKNLC